MERRERKGEATKRQWYHNLFVIELLMVRLQGHGCSLATRSLARWRPRHEVMCKAAIS